MCVRVTHTQSHTIYDPGGCKCIWILTYTHAASHPRIDKHNTVNRTCVLTNMLPPKTADIALLILCNYCATMQVHRSDAEVIHGVCVCETEVYSDCCPMNGRLDTQLCVCVRACVCVCVCVCVRVRVCACVPYSYIHIYTYVCVYICIYIYIHIYV